MDKSEQILKLTQDEFMNILNKAHHLVEDHDGEGLLYLVQNLTALIQTISEHAYNCGLRIEWNLPASIGQKFN